MPIVKIDGIDGYLDLLLFRLVRNGYGSIVELLNTPVSYIAKALQDSNFVSDFEEEYYRLNDNKKD